MSKKVRVRFAPSPTGPLHIGGVRTALFNYLFARQHGGDFILRIEDTDQNRFVPGTEAYIVESLEWLGIPFDEGPGKAGQHGPYRQSERVHLYRDYALQLLDSGWAYYAFDTTESLDEQRKQAELVGETFIYNWQNRSVLDNSLRLSEKEVSDRLASGSPYVIRFKWPLDTVVQLKDIIRGDIQVDANTLDDKVLFKSDGMPTYHLANIVDDHLMEISHVIRGEEWLPSLPLHCQLYKAFGWNPPEFAHLPLIMKPVGKGKLSKRDGAKLGFPVFPLSWQDSEGYRESGFFPEAVVNFLAMLGWNPGTSQELFTKDELIEAFDLRRVQKSGARFDPEKNKWYNHQYLQQKPIKELSDRYRPVLKEQGMPEEDYSDEFLGKIITLIRDRASFVYEFWGLGSYFFKPPSEFDQKAVKKRWKEDTPGLMEQLIGVLDSLEDFSSGNAEAAVKQWIQDEDLSFGQVMPPFRLAVVGALMGPHLFDITELLGREETVSRLGRAIKMLGSGD